MMEAKVVKFKLLKRIILICNTYIAYVPHSYRLWSTLWHRVLSPNSYLFPGLITLACFTSWNEVSTSTVSSWWKKVSLAPLLPRKFSLLVNMYEKFVLAACLSRQISKDLALKSPAKNIAKGCSALIFEY